MPITARAHARVRPRGGGGALQPCGVNEKAKATWPAAPPGGSGRSRGRRGNPQSRARLGVGSGPAPAGGDAATRGVEGESGQCLEAERGADDPHPASSLW